MPENRSQTICPSDAGIRLRPPQQTAAERFDAVDDFARPDAGGAAVPPVVIRDHPAQLFILCRDDEIVFEIADRLADIGRESAGGIVLIRFLQVETSEQAPAAFAAEGSDESA